MDDFMAAESQEELQNTISMFEQILEVMPNDQLALRTLYKSYLQLDDRARAFDRLNRLMDALLEEGAGEDVLYLVEQFKLFLDFDQEAASARLNQLLSLDSGFAGLESGAGSLGLANAEKDLDQEMALAWRLFQEELLSQEDYSNLLTDLAESSSRELDVPSTVLHVLTDRGFKHIARIMYYMTEHSGAPFISLTGFDFDVEISSILPLQFMKKRAALPFGKLGGEVMIGMLNPFNAELKHDVESITGSKCHVYLVEASEYDLVIKKIEASLSGE